jgi:ribonuclease HI
MTDSADTPDPEFLCYTDGASRGNPGPASYSFLVIRNGAIIHQESGFLGTSTNNVAEYMAVIHALSWLAHATGGHVHIYSDSELVIRQLSGKYAVRKPHLALLYRDVSALSRKFESVTYHSVPRENLYIRQADRLCNEELDRRLQQE